MSCLSNVERTVVWDEQKMEAVQSSVLLRPHPSERKHVLAPGVAASHDIVAASQYNMLASTN